MTIEEFQETIDNDKMPLGLSSPLAALWHAARGDWNTAHDFAQRKNDAQSAWVHAYLHRQEEDLVNADYWYVRAGRSMPEERLEEEWEKIASTLLKEKQD